MSQTVWTERPTWDATTRTLFWQRLESLALLDRPRAVLAMAEVLLNARLDAAAQEILAHATDLYFDCWDKPQLLEKLWDVARGRGEYLHAEIAYREILRIAPDLRGTSGLVWLSLAELLLLDPNRAELIEAEWLLDRYDEPRMGDDHARFRWLIAASRMMEVHGRPDLARGYARKAVRFTESEAGPEPEGVQVRDGAANTLGRWGRRAKLNISMGVVSWLRKASGTSGARARGRGVRLLGS